MKKLTKKCLYSAVAVAALSVAFTTNAKAEIYPIQGNNLWFVGGHAEGGVYKNEYWNGNNGVTLLNNYNSDIQFNQGVVSAGKKLDTTKAFDMGGRIDYMFGTDAEYLQSRGLERFTGHGSHGWGSGEYYHAIAQMYLEAGFNNVNVKAGKFLSPFGSESWMSPDRNFYSMPISTLFAPVTLTGVTASWNFNDALSFTAGWANGEDSFFDTSEANAFLGGVAYKIDSTKSVSYDVLLGNEESDSRDYTYWVNALKFKYNPANQWEFNTALNYRKNNENFSRTESYVLSQEALYKFNPEWAVAGRLEYGHVDAKVRGLGTNKIDLYSVAVAANYTPCDYLIIKPELRYDYNSDEFFDHNTTGGDKAGQLSGGVSVIVKF